MKTEKSKEIYNADLRLNPHQYTIEELEANIDNFRPTTLYQTQTLTATFCAKYILNPKLKFSSEDSWFDYVDVLEYQPHLSGKKLNDALLELPIPNHENTK